MLRSTSSYCGMLRLVYDLIVCLPHYTYTLKPSPEPRACIIERVAVLDYSRFCNLPSNTEIDGSKPTSVLLLSGPYVTSAQRSVHLSSEDLNRFHLIV